MTTKEYFLSLGYTEEETTYILKRQTIRDVEILKQRIEDYKFLLRLNDKEILKIILKYPSILNLRPNSSNHKSTNEKIDDYAEMLKLPLDEVKILMKRCPALLGRVTKENETSAKYRIECYAKLLKTDEKTISRLVKKFPVLLNLDITEKEDCSIAKKMRDLQTIFQASEDEIIKMVKFFPSLLSHSTNPKDKTSIQRKVATYSELLNITEEEIISLIRKCPNIIGLDVYSNEPSSVKSKIKDYKVLLNADDKEVARLIKCQPAYLTYNTNTQNSNENNNENLTSVKNKLNKYTELLNTDLATVQNMIKKAPTLLGLDLFSNSKTSVSEKIKALLSFTTLDNIIENPMLLTFPAKRVKLRYLILSNIINKDELISNKCTLLIRSEKSLWARTKYLEGTPGSPNRILYNNSTFERLHKVKENEIEEMFPITIEDIHQLENQYYEKYGERVTLDDSEIEEVLGM